MAIIHLIEAEGSLNVGLAASYEGAALPGATDDVRTRGGTARLFGSTPTIKSFTRTAAHTGPLGGPTPLNLTVAASGETRIEGGAVNANLSGTLRDLTITAPGDVTLSNGSATLIALGGATRVSVRTDFEADCDIYTGQSVVLIEPYGGGGTAKTGELHIGGGTVQTGRTFDGAVVCSAPIGSFSAPRIAFGRLITTHAANLNTTFAIMLAGGLVDWRSSEGTVETVTGEAGVFSIENAPGDVTITNRTRAPNVEFREGPTNEIIDGGTPDEFGSGESLLA